MSQLRFSWEKKKKKMAVATSTQQIFYCTQFLMGSNDNLTYIGTHMKLLRNHTGLALYL